MSKDNANAKRGSTFAMDLVLNSDTTLGIMAGLTMAAAQQGTRNDSGEDEKDDAAEENLVSASAPVSMTTDRGTGKKKRMSRGGGVDGALDLAGLQQPSQQSPASSVKKYSALGQRDVIRQIQAQNQLLKQELAIEWRDAQNLLARDKRERIGYLERTIEGFSNKVEVARKSVARLEELIAKKEQELEMLRQKQCQTGDGGATASTSAHASASASASAGQSTTESSTNLNISGGAGGGSAMNETGAAMARQVRALENRLELALVKRNEMDSINKHLRFEIDKVHRDRAIFDGIYKKLERELSEYQTRHDESMVEMQRALQEKEHVEQDVVRLQAEADTEQQAYDTQFRELKQRIEAEMREAQEQNEAGTLFGLMCADWEGGSGLNSPKPSHGNSSKNSSSTSSSTGRSFPMGGGSPLHHHAGPSTATAGGTATATATATANIQQENPLRRITALSSWKIGFDKALLSANESVVAKYDQVFDGIKQLTGISDVDQLAQAIVSKDEANFKRFKRVEELHREEVALRAEVAQVTAEIERVKAQEGIATSATQKQQYRALAAQHALVLEQNRAFDTEFEETTAKLTRLKSSVHSIHAMLVHANCARHVDAFSQGSSHLALGSQSARDVTDANVLEFLQGIETFTSSLMKENHELELAHAVAPAAGVGSGSKTHQGAVASVGSVMSPVGHGPVTLPSDPNQKLRVQVPSFGGLNGAIIVPATSYVNEQRGGDQGHRGNHLSPTKLQQQQQIQQQQQQRKKTGRFELSSRKSLSQLQFAAALAAASHPSPADALEESRPGTAMEPEDHEAARGSNATTASLLVRESPRHSVDDDEAEEERAYTYDELRRFAARHIVKKQTESPSKQVPRTSK